MSVKYLHTPMARERKNIWVRPRKTDPGWLSLNVASGLICIFAFDATAYDAFAGYLLLDGVGSETGTGMTTTGRCFGPSWHMAICCAGCGSDHHASSLGFNLTDQASSRLVDQQRVTAWCEKGTAWRFEHDHGRPNPDSR